MSIAMSAQTHTPIQRQKALATAVVANHFFLHDHTNKSVSGAAKRKKK
jgi:hypothetical protein